MTKKKSKKYQKPKILSREKIEARANVCPSTSGGKAAGSSPPCSTLTS